MLLQVELTSESGQIVVIAELTHSASHQNICPLWKTKIQGTGGQPNFSMYQVYFLVWPSIRLGQHEQMSVHHSALHHHSTINNHCKDAILTSKLQHHGNSDNAPGATLGHSSPVVPRDGNAQWEPS